MKPIHIFLGIICAFALMITLLITSVEAVTYWTPGYYEKEYTKYHVLENVHMEMEDLLDVTKEMMAYLRGRRQDLHVPTTVNGQPREFFNQREIAHMEDVRGLFLAAIAIRRICLLLILASIVLLSFMKAEIRYVLPRTICAGTFLFFALLASSGGHVKKTPGALLHPGRKSIDLRGTTRVLQRVAPLFSKASDKARRVTPPRVPA